MQLHTARARESIVRSENKEQGPLAEKRASGLEEKEDERQ